MEGVQITLFNNEKMIVRDCKYDEFIGLINSNNQFLDLEIIRFSRSENYYRDEDEPYNGLIEKIVLNKNLIIEFAIYYT